MSFEKLFAHSSFITLTESLRKIFCSGDKGPPELIRSAAQWQEPSTFVPLPCQEAAERVFSVVHYNFQFIHCALPHHSLKRVQFPAKHQAVFFSSACPATCYFCPSGCTLNSIKETTGYHRLIKYVQHLITYTKGCQPLQEVEAALPLHVESRDWSSLLFNRTPRHL